MKIYLHLSETNLKNSRNISYSRYFAYLQLKFTPVINSFRNFPLPGNSEFCPNPKHPSCLVLCRFPFVMHKKILALQFIQNRFEIKLEPISTI